MKLEFIKVIEDFVIECIAQDSEYIWLTNFKNYGTMFKTNFNIEKTVENIVDIVDGDSSVYDIEDIKLDYDNCVVISIKTVKGNEEFRLFDYTIGVIESK